MFTQMSLQSTRKLMQNWKAIRNVSAWLKLGHGVQTSLSNLITVIQDGHSKLFKPWITPFPNTLITCYNRSLLKQLIEPASGSLPSSNKLHQSSYNVLCGLWCLVVQPTMIHSIIHCISRVVLSLHTHKIYTRMLRLWYKLVLLLPLGSYVSISTRP